MKYRGSGLVEYAVPLALIGLVVGVGVYSLASSGNLLNMFLGSSNSKYDSSTKSTTLNHKENMTASVFSNNPNVPDPVIQSTGTPPKPQATCTSGSCSIDFGSFTLSGIPESFGDFVNSNGSSGGSDKLASILEQIAKVLQEQGDAAGAAQYNDLANLTHILADEQKIIENQTNICSSVTDSLACINNATRTSNVAVRQISSVNSYLNYFYSNTTTTEKFTAFTMSGYIEYKRSYPNYRDTDGLSPSYQIVQLYQDIMSNPNYSQNIKNLTTEVISEVNKIETNLNESFCNAAYSGQSTCGHGLYDIVSNSLVTPAVISTPDIPSITNPQSSKFSDLNAAFVCVAGHNNDTNNTCHQ